eukprot:g5828.t1
MLVYDNDGVEFAAKRFEESEEGDLDPGVVREIAMLRLLAINSSCCGGGSATATAPSGTSGAHAGGGDTDPAAGAFSSAPASSSSTTTTTFRSSYPATLIPCLDITLIEEGGLCMIMPKYKSDVYNLIVNKELTKQKDQLRVMHGSFEGLKYLHDRGIMHRDLKSDNIMVDDQMQPVLIDFSLCKFVANADPVFSGKKAETGKSSGRPKKKDKKKDGGNGKNKKKADKDGAGAGEKQTTEVGTSTYIAPEVFRGEDDYDERADIWSMGVICQEILTKKVMPDDFKDKDAFNYLADIRKKLKPEQPLSKLLLGCLAEDMKDRFRCADALGILQGMLKIEENKEAPAPTSADSTTIIAPTAKQTASLDASNLCKLWAELIDFGSKTRDTAEAYCGILEEKRKRQYKQSVQADRFEVLYLVLIAAKLWEIELCDIWDLDEEWAADFKKFDQNAFIEKEIELAMELDWSLYARKHGK